LTACGQHHFERSENIVFNKRTQNEVAFGKQCCASHKRCGLANDVAIRANIWYDLNEVSRMISDIWAWIVENKDFLIALIALILTVLQLIVSFIKNREKNIIFNKRIPIGNGSLFVLLV